MDGLNGENNDGNATGTEEQPGLVSANADDLTLNQGEPGQEEPKTEETSAEAKELEKIRELVTEGEGDSDLVKNLRQVLRNRISSFESLNEYLSGKKQEIPEAPQLSEKEQKAVSLYDSLFDFDANKGTPVTTGFVNQVYENGPNLASQVAHELAGKPFREGEIQGWTIGHELLQSFGLDPFKIDLLREVSSGKANLTELGIVDIPSFVPEDYRNAYKSLPHALRVDVDNYLSAEGASAEERRAAGLRVLQDRHYTLQREESELAAAQETETRIANETNQEAARITETTFNNILDSLGKSEVYKSVKISNDPLIDSSFKESIIAQINALGDDNSILANRAVTNLAKYGVAINKDQVKNLLQAIETNAQVIAKAEMLQKANPKLNYKPQIEAARHRMSDATSKAIALGNRYFSTAVQFVTNGGKVPTGVQPPSAPNLGNNGIFNGQGNSSESAKSMNDLTAMALKFAKQNAEGASGV